MQARILLATVALSLLSTTSAWGQPGRGGFGGGGFGGSDFRQRMMERMDRNGDGSLDESEVPERAREFVLRAARDSGGGGSFPIKISSLSSGGSDRGRGDRGRGDNGSDRGGRGSDRGRDRGRGEQSEEEFAYPLVPRFGDEVAGFGIDPRQLAGRIVDYEKQYDERVIRQLQQTMGSHYCCFVE